MMRCVVLCGLVLVAAAAPYLKDQAATAEGHHVIEKRSEEAIVFGNHQNKPREKKSDRRMVVNVKPTQEFENKGVLPVPEGKNKVYQNKSAGQSARKIAKSVTKTMEISENKAKNTDRSKDVIKTHKMLVKATKQNLKSKQRLLPGNKETNMNVGGTQRLRLNPKAEIMNKQLMKQIYDPSRYYPVDYSTYYYNKLRQAFRRKRQAVYRKRSLNAKPNRRSKRGLGYGNRYYPFNNDDNDETVNEDGEIASILSPYIREALKERYGDVMAENPEIVAENPNDLDRIYNYRKKYDENEEVESRLEEEQERDDVNDLLDSYLHSGSYPNDDTSDEYIIPEAKRVPLLSMVPGNRRKRFEYPYSLEPQGHWGGFVGQSKRGSYQEAYDKLYRLAAVLARRNAYTNYLEDLESYKK